MRILAALILTITASSCTSFVMADNGCRFTADRNAAVAVENASQAKIIARAGKLNIQGRPGLTEVRIHGAACASDQDTLGSIKLTAEKRGSEIFVEAILPESGHWLNSGQAQLDLEIEVPETLMLDVEDGSGALAIRGAQSLRLNDGSGSVDIEDIAGDVYIHDGSGGIDVKGVGGSVEVEDGSGGLSVSDVQGNVKLQDGSGSMSISRVTGNVTVTRDGSGSISVSQIKGDFTVERDGSGSVHYQDIGGRVSVSD